MLFTYSEEIRKEARRSGRKNACQTPYRPRNRIKFWKMYVILLWRVSSLISSSQLLELLKLHSYLMITGTFTCRLINGFAFSILSSSSSVVSCIIWALLQAKEWACLYPKPIIEIPEPHKDGSLAGLSCPSPRQQQPDTSFSPETKISLSNRGVSVSWMQHHFCIGSKCANIFWFKSKNNFPLIVLCKKQDYPNSTEKTWIPKESGLVPKFLVSAFLHTGHLLLFVHFLSY